MSSLKNCWFARRKRVVGCVLLLLTVALYWPVLTYDYVSYDDPRNIVQNSHINTGLHWRAAGWFFQAGFGANWHPLTWFSHALDFQIYGRWAGGHHLTNVLLHALSAVALFLLLQRFTRAFWRSAVVAALFAWHPLRVESVAWISERKDCLSCLLWILTLWAYLRYAEEFKVQSQNNIRAARSAGCSRFKIFYVLSVVFFVLGLMAKPMVVTLPFVLLLLDYWPLGRLHVRTARDLVIEKIPFFLLSAAGCVVTVIAQARGGAVQSVEQVPLAFRFWNAANSYLWYMEKTFWPKGLAVIYPLAKIPTWLIVTSFFVLVLISGLAWRWRRLRPYFLFGWCWYLGTLVPVLGLLQAGVQATADRYSYIPSIGLLIVIGWGVGDLAAKWQHHRPILGMLGSAVLISCMAATRLQLPCWKDGEALSLRAVTVMPGNFVAWDILAAYHLERGRLDETRLECEKALRANPGDGFAHHNLGEVLMAQKKPEQAADQFRLTIKCLPNEVGPRLELGNILLAQRKPEEAAVQFQDALRLKPNSETIHFSLAKALAQRGSVEDARQELIECLRIKPDDAEPHALLAALLNGQGKTAEAIPHYQQVVRLRPNSIDGLNNLAWVLATDTQTDLRDGPEAVRLATRACELTHYEMPLLIGTLAAAYAEAGRFDEAVAAAQKAHDLAMASGKTGIAAKNLELLKLYNSHIPFHENQ